MRLIPEWKAVLLRAWSTRLMALAFVIDAAQQTLPYVADYLPWWVPLLVLGLAFLARHVKQENLPDA